MSSIELNQLPGLEKNLARVKRVEDSWREKAFLPVGVTINGVDVLQMTLRHMTILMELRNPFLVGGEIRPEHVGEVLWVLSPHYSVDDVEKRSVFLAELVENYPPEDDPSKQRFQIFYRAIHRYIWIRALMDLPPSRNEWSSNSRIATCFAAGIIHRIASTYHGALDAIFGSIFDAPVAALYQLWKWIDAENSTKERPQFNPLQDRVTQYYYDRYMEASQANAR